MKKTLLTAFAIFLTGALLAPAWAQEADAGQAQAAEAPAPAAETPPAPAIEKKAKKKPAKKAAGQQVAAAPAAVPAPAAEAAGIASGETAPVAAAPVPQPAISAPAPAVEPAMPVTARRSSCQACFQTLPAGYEKITSELKPWMAEMEGQAADLDQRLSDIQKRIDGKDGDIEKARLIANKKESKAAVKNLGKERKALLKEYSEAAGQKEDFYKKFSKDVEKRTRAHLKLLEDSLRATLSAASD